MRLPSPEVEEEGGQEERGEQEDAPSHCGNHVQFDRHLQECICNERVSQKQISKEDVGRLDFWTTLAHTGYLGPL